MLDVVRNDEQLALLCYAGPAVERARDAELRQDGYATRRVRKPIGPRVRG